MALQTALQFIRQARRDEALKQRLQSLGRPADLPAVVQLGAAAGFVFTVEELQAAFKHDWMMRWARYGADREGAVPKQRSSE